MVRGIKKSFPVLMKSYSLIFQPPVDFTNPKVDGSKLRTASKVHLGNDDQLNSYNTTMTDNFKVQKGSIEKPIGDVHNSSIPTDYYSKIQFQLIS